MQKDLNIAKTLSENKRETISIQKHFSEDEVVGLKDELTLALSKFKSTEAEFKEIAADWKSQLKEIKQEIDELLESIEMKFEFVDVECFEMPDLDNDMILYVDCKTGEVHESRNMTHKEKQLNFSQVSQMREVSNA
jgi:hypothetical protein